MLPDTSYYQFVRESDVKMRTRTTCARQGTETLDFFLVHMHNLTLDHIILHLLFISPPHYVSKSARSTDVVMHIAHFPADLHQTFFGQHTLAPLLWRTFANSVKALTKATGRRGQT